MKQFIALLCLTLFATLAFARDIPTPAMAMQFDMQKDTRQWTTAFADGNETSVIMEFVPAGQDIESWTEMVSQQTLITRAPLQEFVDHWHNGLLGADPDIQYSEQSDPTGAITIGYRSNRANEAAISKFIQGPDGIYMLAYHARPGALDQSTYQRWQEIIAGAVLVKTLIQP